MEKQNVYADAPLPSPGVVTHQDTEKPVFSPAAGDIAQHQQDNEKQGSKCCGFCCDMRRAVIILNIIFVVFSAISLITYAAGPSILYQDFDDDAVTNVVEDSYTTQSILSGISVAVYILVIFGAKRYNMILVGVGPLWLIVQFISGIVITLNTYNDIESNYGGSNTLRALPYFYFIVQGVITAVLIYPHVGLILEIKKGIMTPDTNSREEFSCCCV